MTLTNEVINAITDTLVAMPERFRANVEFAKLEHHDGEIIISRFGDIAEYSRTQCAANIILWYNALLTKEEIREQVKTFVNECQKRDLAIEFEKDNIEV